MMYHHRRSRSRSPPLLQLPQDMLRITELEHKVAALEAALSNLTKGLHSWQKWEGYLCRVYAWAFEVATALAKFPWGWGARSADANVSETTAADAPDAAGVP